MLRTLLVLSLSTVFLLGSACHCSKEQDPTPTPDQPAAPVTPDPEPESMMDRAVIYLNSSKPSVLRNYSPGQISSGASIKDSEFKFSALADKNQLSNSDFLVMTIAASQLKPGLVGNYPLRSLPDPTQGTVYTTYSFTGNSTYRYSQSDNRMEGSFQITAYDASRKLISGKYEVVVTSVDDPYNAYRAICDVKVTGAFSNIKVQ